MSTAPAALLVPAPLPADPARQSPFIISPALDGGFFFLSSAVVFVAWFAASILRLDSFYILAGVAVVANGPHLVSTWTRVYFDRREWRSRPFLIVGMPLLIAAAVASLTHFAGDLGQRALNSLLLYWATWHFVAQNW